MLIQKKRVREREKRGRERKRKKEREREKKEGVREKKLFNSFSRTKKM